MQEAFLELEGAKIRILLFLTVLQTVNRCENTQYFNVLAVKQWFHTEASTSGTKFNRMATGSCCNPDMLLPCFDLSAFYVQHAGKGTENHTQPSF